MGQLALSPDDARVAITAFALTPTVDKVPLEELERGFPFRLVVRPITGPGASKVIDLLGFGVWARWMPDGKEIVVVRATAIDRSVVVNHLLDPVTGQTRPLALPGGCRVLDVATDGKTFLVEYRQKDVEGAKLGLAKVGGERVKVLTDLTPADLKAPVLPATARPLLAWMRKLTGQCR